MGIGTSELLIILVIVLLVFGSSKLPELGAGLGKSIRNFKKAASGEDEADAKAAAEKKRTEESGESKKV